MIVQIQFFPEIIRLLFQSPGKMVRLVPESLIVISIKEIAQLK